MANPSAEPPSSIRELESILCANGLPAARPLSARDYREWRSRVRGASDRVQATQASDAGPAALVLRTSLSDDLAEGAAPMRIREAELVVRADDWHPLAQRFVVQTADDVISYELRELSFEVVALASVAPAFFEERRETAAPAVAASAVDAVSEADVIAAEVQAWEALHRLGALLGEPVEIVRAPASPRVEVRGLASSQERKQAIVDAVGAIPLVTVDVRTVAEALAAKPKRDAAFPSSPSPATSPTPDEPAPDRAEARADGHRGRTDPTVDRSLCERAAPQRGVRVHADRGARRAVTPARARTGRAPAGARARARAPARRSPPRSCR